MISETQKEIWIREAAARLTSPKQRKTIEDDIEAMKWQYDYDKVELDAKDESIIQMDMTVFERVQSVCRYRCAKIGDTYKCAKGDNFGETCSKKNCPIIK